MAEEAAASGTGDGSRPSSQNVSRGPEDEAGAASIHEPVTDQPGFEEEVSGGKKKEKKERAGCSSARRRSRPCTARLTRSESVALSEEKCEVIVGTALEEGSDETAATGVTQENVENNGHPEGAKESEPSDQSEIPSSDDIQADESEKVEVEEACEEWMAQYLKKHLNLTSDPSTGKLEDENLDSLLCTVYKLLKNEPPIALTLSTAFIKQTIAKEMDVSMAISNFLEKFEKSDPADITTTAAADADTDKDADTEKVEPDSVLSLVDKLLMEIFERIKSKFDQVDEEQEDWVGEDALKLLGSLAHLEDKHIDARLCFHVFFGRELGHDDVDLFISDENGPAASAAAEEEGQKEEVEEAAESPKILLPDGDLEDIEKIKKIFSILDRYALIQLGKHDDDEVKVKMEKKTEKADEVINKNCVHVDQQIKKWVRNHQKTTEEENWDPLFDLIFVLRQKAKCPYFEPHLISAHRSLKEFDWPEQSHKHSLFFATALTIWLRSHEDAKIILNDLYNLLAPSSSSSSASTGEQGNMAEQPPRDWESLNLCRMILLYLDREEKEAGELKEESEGSEKVSGEESEMDNSAIFPENDDLHKIKNEQFFDWVVHQARQFPDNELIQHFAAQLFTMPLCGKEDVSNEERSKGIIKWLNQYFRNIRFNGVGSNWQIFGLLETPLAMLKIAAQLLPAARVMRIAVNAAKSWLGMEGAARCAWFLQEAMYATVPSPVCVWEMADLGPAYIDEIHGVCKLFVEQGLRTCFTGMLTELGEIYSQDNYLDLHLLDFLETMKAVSFFEDCVKKLLGSSQFLAEMQKIFHTVIDGIEENKDTENIKAVCHMLVFWFALLSKSNSVEDLGSARQALTEEMVNFYEKVRQKETPLANAFEGEKHWHIYFREHGVTCMKILETYLASRESSEEVEEEEPPFFRLAKLLKDTMSRKKDWWLVSYAVVTTATSHKTSFSSSSLKNVKVDQQPGVQSEVEILVSADPDDVADSGEPPETTEEETEETNQVSHDDDPQEKEAGQEEEEASKEEGTADDGEVKGESGAEEPTNEKEEGETEENEDDDGSGSGNGGDGDPGDESQEPKADDEVQGTEEVAAAAGAGADAE